MILDATMNRNQHKHSFISSHRANLSSHPSIFAFYLRGNAMSVYLKLCVPHRACTSICHIRYCRPGLFPKIWGVFEYRNYVVFCCYNHLLFVCGNCFLCTSTSGHFAVCHPICPATLFRFDGGELFDWLTIKCAIYQHSS